MSPAVVPVPSGHAADALLLCLSCGTLGPEHLVYPHTGTSPECTEPLTLVPNDAAEDVGYVLGSNMVIEVDPDDVELPDDDDTSETETETEPTPADGSATLTPASSNGKPRSLGTANAKTGSIGRTRPARNAHRNMKVNLPVRNQGAKVVRPDPVTVSVTVKVSLYTLALWDVARNDPEISFDGTLEDFLDECPQALFDTLDYDGLFLVKRNKAMIERLEQSDPRMRSIAAAVGPN